MDIMNIVAFLANLVSIANYVENKPANYIEKKPAKWSIQITIEKN